MTKNNDEQAVLFHEDRFDVRLRVAEPAEINELKKLSTEKLIIWIVGRSRELGITLTPEDIVLEAWLINPEKHSLRGYRQFPCSRTVLKRVGEMKGKKALLIGSEMSGYGLTEIAKRQYADLLTLIRHRKVTENAGHSAANREISSRDEAPYKRLRKTPAYEKLNAGHPEQIVETDFLYFYGISWHTKRSVIYNRIQNVDAVVKAFGGRDPLLQQVHNLLNERFTGVRKELMKEKL